eukprot:TRINITY_DN5047_c0_g1_i1.p1 TRINITY_DN5047_c0_g1~~TRINITY_DN5047_c0_g1_i1.p1  ORF type:complete len:558 (+),score=59.51 TRINITY_DN5047_c0_g1_i1:197-1870(+)
MISWRDTKCKDVVASLADPWIAGVSNDVFHLRRCTGKGACVVASRNLPEGTELLRDRPLLAVCKQDLSMRCLRCIASFKYAPQRANGSVGHHLGREQRCARCGHGWCGISCRNADAGLHIVECHLLQLIPAAVRACSAYNLSFHHVVVMLRGLAVRAAEPARWANICKLEDHWATAESCDSRFDSWRKAAQAVYLLFAEKQSLIDLCQDSRGAAEPCMTPTADDALRTLLIFNINALGGSSAEYGGTDQTNPVIAIFPTFCRFEHSCLPNVCFFTEPNGPFEIVASTRGNVRKDENLAISYVLLDEPMHRRQATLQSGKYFRCGCPRCTGFGTIAELPGERCAIRCSRSSCRGEMRPEVVDYDLASAPFTCAACGTSMTFKDVEALEEQMTLALDRAVTVEACDRVLDEFGSRLTRDHFVRFQLAGLTVELLLRPQDHLIVTGRGRDVPEAVVKRAVHLFEEVILPTANRIHIPRRVTQLRNTWCTLFYRLGQARLVLAAQLGGVERFGEAVSSYEEALAETSFCMGQTFASPLLGFVSQLRKTATRLGCSPVLPAA